MNHTGRSVPPRAALALAVAGLSVLAAACGGDGKQAGVAHLGPTTTDRNVAAASTGSTPASPGKMVGDLEKYAQCMRSHGVANFRDRPCPRTR